MAIVKASNRVNVVTPARHGDILELGPASSQASVATFVIQFNPDMFFTGAFVVMARLAGPVPVDVDLPFMPVSYRRVTVNNVASDRTYVADQITGATKIELPSSMDSIGLMVSCLTGSCTIVSWGLQGPST